jgi:hypothetical protein
MEWKDIRTKIRRFLRDPNGNIWDDAFLLRTFNDEQRYFNKQVGMLERVAVVRVPPFYQMAYFYDWEWAQTEHATGKVYQALRYHEQSDLQFCYRFESQIVGFGSGSDNDEGMHYTQPWEAWHTDTIGEPAPLPFPQDFEKTLAIYWDRDPIDFLTIKEISSKDQSWRTREGRPVAYTRRDSESKEFYLYPHADTPVFDDVEGRLDYYGQVLFDDSNTESAETGAIADTTGQVLNSDEGAVTESLETDDNILLIYEADCEDLADITDEGNLTNYLQKYVEYATLERSYSANTDGKIKSLQDYWQWRAKLGVEIVKRFKLRRRTDRDYRLITKTVGRRRGRQHPRLPDSYPALYV